jgi:putative FmdB family regulatory protein
MPIYEYECRACRHQFEALVLRTSPAAECPVCHKTDLQQLISLASASTDSSRSANLGAAHRKMAGIRNAKQRENHKNLHEHFHDPQGGAKS